ncbi:hypothetical protein F4775DRAFT_577797 [Biscogniauxia sp. FL1348]|nr:hypothetical protein F4775DRAFT_577797 [Biscogniauxia sp. FL1348]
MSTHPQQPPKPLDLTTALHLASHPASASTTSTSTSPTSPQHERDAARGVSGAEAWKPRTGGEAILNNSSGGYHRRRPSYSQEDRKHELQMSGLGLGIGAGGSGSGSGKGMTTGFTET